MIVDCVRYEKELESHKNIRDSCQMCFGIIKNGQNNLTPVEFAKTAKPPLQKAYSECLEFLIFRALAVIVDDPIQRRLDIIQLGLKFLGHFF